MQWEILIATILVIGIGLAIKGALNNRISRRAMTGEATGKKRPGHLEKKDAPGDNDL
jgi:hypothetical protein